MAYFQKMASMRKKNNNISSLKCEMGILSDEKEIWEHIPDLFLKIFLDHQLNIGSHSKVTHGPLLVSQSLEVPSRLRRSRKRCGNWGLTKHQNQMFFPFSSSKDFGKL